MYEKISNQLDLLPEPTLFDIKTYDELLVENIALAKIELSTEEVAWNPLESDFHMKNLRVLTLRQLHNQNSKKNDLKKLLVTTATGIDLDYLGVGQNVMRDEGEYPYAEFEFTLLVENKQDVTIPRGVALNNDDDTFKAHVTKDIVILAGEVSAVGILELQSYLFQSDVKTERLVTDLPFGVIIKQVGIFNNGSDVESDRRYRLRIIGSSDKHSTAGSEESYIVHALGSDNRIDDVVVRGEKVLDVNIYLASFSPAGVDLLMIKRVTEACNAKYVRPLNDNVIVAAAEIISLNITATIEVFDLLKQGVISDSIKANFNNSFFIGQNFVLSDFMRKCHINGVYKVSSDFTDVIIDDSQIIKIESLELYFKEASL